MQDIFISCAPFLEPLLFEELKKLGIPDLKKGFHGVSAPKKMEYVYKINYCSRLASRVLWPLAHFPCPDREALYASAKKIPWLDFLKIEQTFSIDANVSHPNLKHSLFAALVVKDALCDVFRDKKGQRPNVDTTFPDVQFHLFIHKGIATISLDTSGDPLYKRGYRENKTIAPLQESLAAAALLSSGYQQSDILCDPFCGSGTFLIEAAMLASKTPAGFFRKKWGFFRHPQFSYEEWMGIKAAADAQKISLEPGKMIGADKDPETLDTCSENLEKTGFKQYVDLSRKDIENLRSKIVPTFVITNPPYGKRLDNSVAAYQLLGNFLRQRKTKAFALAPSKRSIEATGLSFRPILSLMHGGLEVELYTLT